MSCPLRAATRLTPPPPPHPNPSPTHPAECQCGAIMLNTGWPECNELSSLSWAPLLYCFVTVVLAAYNLVWVSREGGEAASGDENECTYFHLPVSLISLTHTHHTHIHTNNSPCLFSLRSCSCVSCPRPRPRPWLGPRRHPLDTLHHFLSRASG